MTEAIVWISGASSGIGRALADTVPWEGARIIGISRRRPDGLEHLEADLSDPAQWARVGRSFDEELARSSAGRIAFFHCAGTVQPIGYAGEVDPEAYRANVVLNSAAPQVLGNLFLQAVRGVEAERALVLITSGAARSVYPGWSSYGAGKAAVDQWVRNAGAEQAQRGGVRVLSVAPGTVDTGMQAELRETEERDFPQRRKFVDLHRDGKLTAVREVAEKMWRLLDGDLDSGSVVDLRQLSAVSGRG